jgi:hypothetical protein
VLPSTQLFTQMEKIQNYFDSDLSLKLKWLLISVSGIVETVRRHSISLLFAYCYMSCMGEVMSYRTKADFQLTHLINKYKQKKDKITGTK